MKTIPLSRGMQAKVDDADYRELSRFKWYALKVGGTFYAARNGKPFIYMHRSIMRPGKSVVDHINGDGLDNRRSNLRATTKSINGLNRRGLNKNNTSGARGVSWHRKAKKWEARMMLHGKNVYLGLFAKKSDAVRAVAKATAT